MSFGDIPTNRFLINIRSDLFTFQVRIKCTWTQFPIIVKNESPFNKYLPIPEVFIPPNGHCGNNGCEQLIHTVPACNWFATLLHFSVFSLITPAASPYSLSLADSIASCSVLNVRTERTGPKISSTHADDCFGTF